MAGETGGFDMGSMGGGGGGGGMSWIGSIVGTLAAGKTAYSANKQTQEMYERWKRYYHDAIQLLSSKKILKEQAKLFPAMRSAVQYQVGQNYEKDVASSLSQQGLLNSSTGTALLDAAKAMPDQIAGAQSLERAIELNKMKSQIKMSMAEGSTQFRKQDVRTEAGLGLARSMGSGSPQGSSAGSPGQSQQLSTMTNQQMSKPSGQQANLQQGWSQQDWVNNLGWYQGQ